MRYAIKCSCCFSGQCQTALGMESGAIPDDAITASSSYKEGSVGPESARSVVELIHVIHVIVCVRLHVDNEFACIIKEDWEFLARIDIDVDHMLSLGLESLHKNTGLKNFSYVH